VSRLVLVEMRRALTRRAIRVLILIGVLLIVLTASIALAKSGNFDARSTDQHIARMTSMWPEGQNDADSDSVLSIAGFFLVVGALFGGATALGAEWRVGTMTTLLTWEPRRVRLLVAKLAACAALAFVIGVLLQALLLAALVPTYVVHGTTAGADASWWAGYAGAVARMAVLAACGAAVGGALAALARNTVATLIAAFVYLNILENVARAWKPWLGRYLIGDNAAAFLLGRVVRGDEYTREPIAGLVILLVYLAILSTAAIALFARRDVTT
jgi:ABC-type transport system involved in multi-copper enzyme maturation permease subunit